MKVPRNECPNFWIEMGLHFTHQWVSGAWETTTTCTGKVNLRHGVRVVKKKKKKAMPL